MDDRIDITDAELIDIIRNLVDNAKDAPKLGLYLRKDVQPVISLNPSASIATYKEIVVQQIDPTLAVDYGVLNISGSGMFYGMAMNTNDGATVITRRMRVTIDGVLYTLYSLDEASALSVYAVGLPKAETLGWLSKDMPVELLGPISFRNSLVVVMSTDTTLVGGKYIEGEAYYGEVE